MIFMRIIFISAFFITTVLLSGCTGTGKKRDAVENTVQPASVAVNDEALQLLKDLDEMGDYVNSKNFPSLIKSSIVYEELGTNNLVIDLRTPKTYADGHIKGAVNVQFKDLPVYFESGIKPFEFGKIILVCSTGQVSRYATSL